MLFTNKKIDFMKHYPLFVLLSVLLLSSCFKDEPLNNECDILSAWVEGDEYADNFYHDAQMRIENISSGDKDITFSIRSLMLLPKSIPVHFTLTPGATIQPENGSAQDFTAGPVTYTVTSEDGTWKRQYTVSFKEATMPTFKFAFENVRTIQGINDNKYHEFFEVGKDGTVHNIWASGNAGAILIKINSAPEDQPTYSTPDGYVGRGVCLNTQSAGSLGAFAGKPIAAGNLFMGRFIFENVITNPLKTTEFGRAIDRIPVRATGYYKYRPGEIFTDKDMNVVPGRVDEASIYAVFYRNKDENGKDVFLYGDDVLTSPYIIKKAVVASLPPTDEWTRFEMFFEGSEASQELALERGYSLALVFSSSKDGASFEGAIGSVLYIDEVEVSFEDINEK